MRDGLPYDDWKKELKIWCGFTDLDKKRQGPTLFLTPKGKARETVLAEVEADKLQAEDGVDKVTNALDKLYKRNDSESAFTAFENFIKFRRHSSMSITDYIIEFRLSKIKSHKMDLPDGVLAYYLLQCANLTEDQTSLCRATCEKLTYENMKAQIGRVSVPSVTHAQRASSQVHVEPQYVTQYKLHDDSPCYDEEELDTPTDGDDEPVLPSDTYYSHIRPSQGSKSMRAQEYSPPSQTRKQKNPPDEFGNPNPCRFCKSIYHWVDRCPDVPADIKNSGRGAGHPRRYTTHAYRGRGYRPGGRGGYRTQYHFWLGQESEDVEDVMLLAEDEDEQERLFGETIGCAIVDSGCTTTVCGDLWLYTYLDSLSQKDRKSTYTESASRKFRFGAGKIYSSNRVVHIPVHIGNFQAILATHVVSCDIPLLLSRSSLKKADAVLDFKSDSLRIFGDQVPLIISESGHCCLPLSHSLEAPHDPGIQRILFTNPIGSPDDDEHECKKKVTKLYKQFAHPKPERLKNLLCNAGTSDKRILDMVDAVSQSCDICKRLKNTLPRPAVGLPLATVFNETVALDLKTYRNGYMLHMIDHATRYSQSCFIRNKQKATIVKAVIKFWIGILGSPDKFLSDNGGEFVNDEFVEFAEKFNIKILTTAAESPWSNGLCEKHNGIIGDMIE